MLTIAGGIVLGFLALSAIGALGQTQDGNFSFGRLFGNVFTLGLVVLCAGAILVGVFVLLSKAR
ncbi:MAG: hypothetical protein IPI49_32390 [Myxococcales bacterium]|nr:hypothetical protein [Myxococcales bacterium]